MDVKSDKSKAIHFTQLRLSYLVTQSSLCIFIEKDSVKHYHEREAFSRRKDSVCPDSKLFTSQGIFQKKSASSSQMLLLVIFDKKKCPFFQKQCCFKVFLCKTTPKVPFFKDSGCCPKILDYTLLVMLILRNLHGMKF